MGFPSKFAYPFQSGHRIYHGREVLIGPNSTVGVTFPNEWEDTNYSISLTPAMIVDSEEFVNVACYVTSTEKSGFEIGVSMAPDVDKRISIHWIAIHD